MEYMYSKSALDFGKYGDFTFTGTEFKKLRNFRLVTYQNIFKFVTSNKGDYELEYLYAANLSLNIGIGLSSEVAQSIAEKLRQDIVNKGIIQDQDLEVYPVIEGHTLHLRLMLFQDDNYTIAVQLDNMGVSVR